MRQSDRIVKPFGNTHQSKLDRREKEHVAVQSRDRNKKRRNHKTLKHETKLKLQRQLKQVLLEQPHLKKQLETNPAFSKLAVIIRNADLDIPTLNLLGTAEQIAGQQEQNAMLNTMMNNAAMRNLMQTVDSISVDSGDWGEYVSNRPQIQPPPQLLIEGLEEQPGQMLIEEIPEGTVASTEFGEFVSPEYGELPEWMQKEYAEFESTLPDYPFIDTPAESEVTFGELEDPEEIEELEESDYDQMDQRTLHDEFLSSSIEFETLDNRIVSRMTNDTLQILQDGIWDIHGNPEPDDELFPRFLQTIDFVRDALRLRGVAPAEPNIPDSVMVFVDQGDIIPEEDERAYFDDLGGRILEEIIE